MTNNELKFLRSLEHKKFRSQKGCFLVEGKKSVAELLQSDYKVKAVYATCGWIEKNADFYPDIQSITAKEASQISFLQTSPEIFALAEIKHIDIEQIKDRKELLLLDSIKDAGNLGTIIRTADWLGFRTILCSQDTVELYNPKTIQASMGSFTRVAVIYTDLADFIVKNASKYAFFGADMDGKSLELVDFPQWSAVVLGSESHGISPQIDKLLSQKLSVPSFSNSQSTHAESLNVAQATAIICWAWRQKITKLNQKIV
ncbi:MAG: RNA methyltransferase [Bacteroidales bacterium]|jgi:TrmH family RNA methyltransferase|nr:RNA methyltransferase [Bacteroidales bacterium]